MIVDIFYEYITVATKGIDTSPSNETCFYQVLRFISVSNFGRRVRVLLNDTKCNILGSK